MKPIMSDKWKCRPGQSVFQVHLSDDTEMGEAEPREGPARRD